MTSNEEGVLDAARLAPDDTVDGMVVEISVWTSTMVNRVLYTYGRTCSGLSMVGSQSGDPMPVVIVLFNTVVVGLTYDWNSLSSIWLSTSRTVLASSVSLTENDVSKLDISCGT